MTPPGQSWRPQTLSKLARPNVMIKIPRAGGIPPSRIIYRGINVNITMIFSIELRAGRRGLRPRPRTRAAEASRSRIASVASFFVSRVDTSLTGLEARRQAATAGGKRELENLFGKAVIANANSPTSRSKKVSSRRAFPRAPREGRASPRPLGLRPHEEPEVLGRALPRQPDGAETSTPSRPRRTKLSRPRRVVPTSNKICTGARDHRATRRSRHRPQGGHGKIAGRRADAFVQSFRPRSTISPPKRAALTSRINERLHVPHLGKYSGAVTPRSWRPTSPAR